MLDEGFTKFTLKCLLKLKNIRPFYEKVLSPKQILQMVGRAGRPQFDRSATAVIMTTEDRKKYYEELTSGTRPIESHLADHLEEHINAEIVLGTITDLSIAMSWIRFHLDLPAW